MWFYVSGDESHGPVGEEELARQFSSGDLSPDTLVWREGFGDWRPARDVGVFGDLMPEGATGGATDGAAEPKPDEAATLHFSTADAQRMAEEEAARLKREAEARRAVEAAPAADSEATVMMTPPSLPAPPDAALDAGIGGDAAAGDLLGAEAPAPTVAVPTIQEASPPARSEPGVGEGPLSIDERSCFGGSDGEPDAGRRRKSERLLERVDSRLRAVLRGGEQIQYVTSVFRLPNLKEFLVLWQWALVRLRYVAVVTDQRLLLFPLRLLRREEDAAVSQVARGDANFEMTKSPLLGFCLQMNYKRAEGSERLPWLFTVDRDRLEALLAGGSGPATGFEERTFLCPDCGQELAGITGETLPLCPGCGLQFLDRRDAIRKALVLPGGGYFAVRETVFGLFAAFSEVLLALLVLLGFVLAITGGWQALILSVMSLFGLAILKGFSALYGVVFSRDHFPQRGSS